MIKKPKKLGADKNYQRPKYTYQEQLTADEIEKLLQGYEQVESIIDIPINTHIRYFTTDNNGDHKFRMGGFLHDKSNADKYIILSNGTKSWSVQIKDTVFFKKLSHTEEINSLHKLYKKKLAFQEKEIRRLKKELKRLKITKN